VVSPLPFLRYQWKKGTGAFLLFCPGHHMKLIFFIVNVRLKYIFLRAKINESNNTTFILVEAIKFNLHRKRERKKERKEERKKGRKKEK
jgi:hypothetical protein